MIKVFIDGREGTTGLRIEQRLEKRGGVEILRLKEDLRKNLDARRGRILESDVTFLCLPDAAAIEAVAIADGVQAKAKIIDASTAHRTESSWAYGFPELSADFRTAIASSCHIAVPGCHASGFLALVYPLIKGGFIDGGYPLSCHSLTGYSGGGKSMIAEYEATNADAILKSPAQYALSQTHKHLKEMKAIANLNFEPHFSPIVSNFYSGMEVTVPIHSRLAFGLNLKRAKEFFTEYYAGQKLIKVLDAENVTRLHASKLSNKDGMEIYIGGNDERILLTAVFDNLGKGASGAAVQCMNLALGEDESLGLEI